MFLASGARGWLLAAPAKVVTSQYTEFDTKTRFRAAISPQTKPNPPRDHPDPPHSRQTRAERARSTGGDRRRPEATGGDRRRPEAKPGENNRFFNSRRKNIAQSAFAQQPQQQGGGGGPRGDSTRRRRHHRHCHRRQRQETARRRTQAQKRRRAGVGRGERVKNTTHSKTNDRSSASRGKGEKTGRDRRRRAERAT